MGARAQTLLLRVSFTYANTWFGRAAEGDQIASNRYMQQNQPNVPANPPAECAFRCRDQESDVGSVERSETHHGICNRGLGWWVSLRSTHPAADLC
jgi:hypothetical protein